QRSGGVHQREAALGKQRIEDPVCKRQPLARSRAERQVGGSLHARLKQNARRIDAHGTQTVRAPQVFDRRACAAADIQHAGSRRQRTVSQRPFGQREATGPDSVAGYVADGGLLVDAARWAIRAFHLSSSVFSTSAILPVASASGT